MDETNEKVSILVMLTTILTNHSLTNDEKIKCFNRSYTEKKSALTDENDSSSNLFLKVISSLLTQGFKASYLTWKESVSKIKNTQKIDELISEAPPTPSGFT
jgi:hypothetical protein